MPPPPTHSSLACAAPTPERASGGTLRYSAVLSSTQRYSAVLSGTAPTCRCVGALRIRARVCKWGTERMGRTTKYSTSTAQC